MISLHPGFETHAQLVDLDSEPKNIDPSLLSDEELVTRCKAELPKILDSYEELISRHHTLVLNYCVKAIGNRHDGEEICQDTMLRVFHKIHQFEGRSSFKTWLFRIAFNMCLNRRGTLARRRDRISLFADEVATQERATLDDAGTDDVAANIQKAMTRLDEEKREIINLKFVSGYQIEEIAQILNLKISATKMRLYRARDELKAVYLNQANKSLTPDSVSYGLSEQF